jgi:hypothetical protein
LFNHGQLSPGQFHIYVRNPGGLEGSARGFSINLHQVDEEALLAEARGNEDNFNFYFGLRWVPFVHLFEGAFNLLSDPELLLYGGAVHLGFVNAAPGFLNTGIEFSASWYDIDSLFSGEADAVRSLLLETNFLLQKPFFNRRLSITLRAGMGIVYSSRVRVSQEDTGYGPLDGMFIFANGGLSVLWLPFANFYIETGAGYSHLFVMDNFSGALRPWAGIGVRF